MPAPPPFDLEAPSPLDRIAGHYVELNEMKPQRTLTGSTRVDDSPISTPVVATMDAKPRDTIPEELPQRLEPVAKPSSNWWIVEGVAWIASAIALAVVIATVAMTDGKPLPTWPMDITLNSFISFMTTIMKAAAAIPVAEGISQLKWLWYRKAGAVRDIQTFDEASRGTWGSAKLLVSTRGIHLGKLGAIITIILLAVDPFVQQVVVYEKQPVISEYTNSSVPIVANYSDYAYGGIMSTREPTLSMKAAINNGLFDTSDEPQNDFTISASCATGNCTWSSTYYTLGVCSKCANTTSQITSNCGEQFGTLPATCNYTLPNGMAFDGTRRGQAYMNSSGEYESLAYNNSQSTIGVVSTMRGLHDLSSSTLLGVVSNECVLYVCVNEYQGNVTNGVFTETLVSTYTGDENPVMSENITISVPNSDTEYWFGATAWLAVSMHLSSYFTGSVTGGTGTQSSTSDVVGALFEFGEDGSGSGTQKVGGENNTIASVAAAMTKMLRMYDLSVDSSTWNTTDPNSTSIDRFALGIAWTTETFVHVRWLWMILPVALEVLVLVFLVGTVFQSNRSGLPGWKSSTMPLIQGKLGELQLAIAEKRRSKL
ncbi:hypothetical protein PFICI_09379 [Pestalotiopsis fici W106-1]|uniref:Uncharacterized protein n=1 Tax=Pestalotiopsis fici (strain W106-1 / CGMCC3.15140) TaxID=1229662 RepID=W3X300_PESFW|nr:uncharacterized protein PFICI_09379 [Pestalotiopsis fici W106-1]ETS79526.1 hypothetical protein PFICI_09379 [Pestalotiopsis fici W106-1]